MPIDLAEYSKRLRSKLREGGYCAVYVASVAQPVACKIGYADDVARAVARLRQASPAAVLVESVLWVPSKGIAMIIAKAAQCELAEHGRAGGWLHVSPEKATAAIEVVAVRNYPGITMAWHQQLLQKAG